MLKVERKEESGFISFQKMQIKTNDIHIVMFDAAFPLPVVGGKEKQAFILFNKLRSIGVNAKVLSYSFADHNEDSDVYRVPKGSIIRIVYFLFKMRKTANILHVHTPSRIGIITCIIGKFFFYKTMFKFPNEGLFSDTSSKVLFKIFLENRHIMTSLIKFPYCIDLYSDISRIY